MIRGMSLDLFREDLDKTLAWLGTVASIALVAVLAATVGRLIFILVGVLTAFSCLLWLGIREHARSAFPDARETGRRNGDNRLFAILLVIFLALYSLSIVALYLRASLYERPPGYFILTALMASVIALEILLPRRRKTAWVLPQIVLLGLSVAWSQILLFPSVLGSDPWWHRMFVSSILNFHAVPGGYWYTYMPLFHLEVVGTSLLTGLDYRLAAMLSVSLAQVVVFPLAAHLIGKALFGDERIGLLAGLMLITANQQIGMSTASIPNGFAAIFMALVLVLLFKTNYTSPRRARYLAYFFLAAIILTHTVTAACMAVVLFLTWGACRLYDLVWRDTAQRAYPVTLGMASVFLAAMLGWWYFVSGHITVLLDLIRQGFSRDYFVSNPGVIDAYPGLVPVLEQVFNNIGMFLFFTLSLVGILYLVARRERNGFAFATVGLLLLALGFFPLVTGLSFIEHRWWYFAQILLCVPLAASLLLVGSLRRARTGAGMLVFAAGIGLLVLAMILSPAANNDAHTLSENSAVRTGFTASEMCALDTVDAVRTGPVRADRYVQVVNYVNFDPGFILSGDDMLIEGAYRSHGADTVLIREYIQDRPLFCYDGMFRLAHDPERTLDGEGYDRVYVSGSASLFVLNEP
ncbi:hypothetical protein DSECCO2_66760 [anaerobic digester metagenome]